jgi:hypothetical protein
VVGALELDFETLTTAEEEGQRLLVYTAAEGTPAAEGLALLAHSVQTAVPTAAFSRVADL